MKQRIISLLALTLFFTFSVFAQSDDVRTIEVKGLDNMQFSETLIEADPGEKLRIVFKTISNMPAEVMAHNLALLEQNVDIEAFVMASMVAPENEYIAPDMEDKVIAYTEMIGGGETSTIEFTVPEVAGEYEYVCTFPGHYFGGMRGTLVVRENS